MLSVLVSGLPDSAMGVLRDAMGMAYGDGAVSIEVLDSSRLRSKVRLSNRNVGVVLVILDEKSSDVCKNIESGLYSSSKYIKYTDDYSFTKELNSRYNLDLELPKPQGVLDDYSDDLAMVGLKAINEDLKSRLDKALSEINLLGGKKTELENMVSELSSKVDTLTKENQSLENIVAEYKSNNYEEEISRLLDRVKEDDTYITTLNNEVNYLKEDIRGYEEEIENNLSSILSEKEQVAKYKELSKKLEKELLESKSEIESYKKEVSNLNSSRAKSINQLNIKYDSLLRSVLDKENYYENIEFIFSGSSESRRGTYKCVLERIKNSDNSSKYLFVDLVSEVFSDYIFSIEKVVSGIKWFSVGGNLEKYLSRSDVCPVLVSNIGYVNDIHFLCIDWSSRLRELDSSGYKVIVYCGDISNIVGRVLHESFAGCGVSSIYVLGNVVSSRSVVANLRGISNSSESEIYYFDYNSAASQLYNIACKTNKCEILSKRGSIRR